MLANATAKNLRNMYESEHYFNKIVHFVEVHKIDFLYK